LAKILIAVKDRDIRDLIIFALRFGGYDTFGVSTGEECCTLAKQIRPDLILLDFDLPMMDGSETFVALKRDRDTDSLPVISIVEGGKGPIDRDNIERRGGRVIRKPIDPDLLTKGIRLFLK
jgi:two-component system response regulator (stage 0 sporulation protein F)